MSSAELRESSPREQLGVPPEPIMKTAEDSMPFPGDTRVAGSGQPSNRWEAIGQAFGSVRAAIAKILGSYQERGASSRLAPPPSPSYGSPVRGSSTPAAGTSVSQGTSTQRGGGQGINVQTVSPQQAQAYEVLKKKHGEKKLRELGCTGPQDITDIEARGILLGQTTPPSSPATAAPAVATPTPAAAPVAAPVTTPAAPAFSPPSPPAAPIDVSDGAMVRWVDERMAEDNRARSIAEDMALVS